MNIALSTLVLVILLIPGFLFRRFYYSGEFSKEYFKQNFSDLILPSLILSGIINTFCYSLVYLLGFRSDAIPAISTLLSGTTDSVIVSRSINTLFLEFYPGLSYFIFAGLTGAVAGFLGKYFIRTYKLDRRYKLFRFQNEWHYLFSGEILDFPDIHSSAKTNQLTFVDALVNTSEGSLIYSGILSSYVLSSSTGIDRIYLSDTRRRYLKNDDQNNPERYYDMPGDFFVIFSSQIINLHITYYSI
ncbi:MAG: hypothetical protein EOP42_16775 [Sphingobacteriaceae bacterium]|nr:MAG: hypothetical protein EOP42_16775 [Sphingobacteriaceae bacterium]